MGLKEVVMKYYLEEGCSCSECMMKGCNDYYHLNLSEDFFKGVSGFSGGMYSGYTCGAFTCAVMTLSFMYSTGKAHDSKFMQSAVAFFNKRFMDKVGSPMCIDLKKKYRTPETKCAKTIEIVADIFEEYVNELKQKEVA